MAILRAAVLAAVLLSYGQALGQGRCDSRERLLSWLAGTYGETPIALGVDNGGRLIEVLASADGSTWTLVITSPEGRSCMVSAGEGWRAIPRMDTEAET